MLYFQILVAWCPLPPPGSKTAKHWPGISGSVLEAVVALPLLLEWVPIVLQIGQESAVVVATVTG